jgi:hypothetical protein
MSPRALIQEQNPKSIRVTLADSSRMIFQIPRVANDSIRGEAGGCRYVTRPDGQQICVPESGPAVALDQVSAVETEAFSAGKTVGAVVAVAVTIPVVALIIACSGADDEGFVSPC